MNFKIYLGEGGQGQSWSPDSHSWQSAAIWHGARVYQAELWLWNAVNVSEGHMFLPFFLYSISSDSF